MASQQQDDAGKNDADLIIPIEGEEESSTGESSPDRVLPLDALKSLLVVPECTEDHLDVPACAWDTIQECVTEATVRLAFDSANATAKDKRKVITAEDVTHAIEGLNDKDASLGMVFLEMSAIVAAEKRAAAMRRRQAQRLRQEQKAKEEGAAGTGLQK